MLSRLPWFGFWPVCRSMSWDTYPAPHYNPHQPPQTTLPLAQTLVKLPPNATGAAGRGGPEQVSHGLQLQSLLRSLLQL